MPAISQDLRFALRKLRNSPGFALTAILTLAIGIGANTAVFSVVNAVLLRSLPYEDAGRLVMIWSSAPSQGLAMFSSAGPDYRAWRDGSHSFDGMGAYSPSQDNLSIAGNPPENVASAQATAGVFSTVAARPFLGQSFSARNEQWGEHRVVMLSYGLWQRKFGSDPAIVGKQVHLNGEAFTIVGVMPKDFRFLDRPKAQLWTPLAWAPGDNMNTRNNHYLLVVGRLRPGITLEAAQSDLQVVAAHIARQFPENAGLGVRLQTVRDRLVGGVRPALLALFGAVLFVLLVACVNLANLMLTDCAARRKEFGIRSAMGASRYRLIRQFISESTLLAAFGAIGGVAAGSVLLRAATAMLPSTFPMVGPIGVDPTVLGFTSLLGIGSVLFFGIVPAIESSAVDPQRALHDNQRGATQGRRSRRLRSSLVITEIALAAALLVGAGLLIKSFSRLLRQDLGFDPRNVLTFELPLSGQQYVHHDDRALAFVQESINRVQALPGVQSVGASNTLPLGYGVGWGKNLSGEGFPPMHSMTEVPNVNFNLISPDYFKAMAARVGQGRALTNSDTANSQPVAVVNQAFVRRFYPQGDALGKTIRLLPPDNLLPLLPPLPPGIPPAPGRVIVGVVADMKNGDANLPTDPEVFAPMTQQAGEGWGPVSFAVRTDNDPGAMVHSIAAAIASLDSQQPITAVAPMNDLLGRSIAQARFNAILLAMFAALALLLAAIGICGVVSFGITNRTQEIGVRMALGADRRSVLAMVLGESLRSVGLGLAAGLVLALALTRLIHSLMFNVGTADPAVYATISVVLAAAAFVATLLPARRAASIEPMQALRTE